MGSTKYGVTGRAVLMDIVVTYILPNGPTNNELLLNELKTCFKKIEETTGIFKQIIHKGHYFTIHNPAKKITIEITLNRTAYILVTKEIERTLAFYPHMKLILALVRLIKELNPSIQLPTMYWVNLVITYFQERTKILFTLAENWEQFLIFAISQLRNNQIKLSLSFCGIPDFQLTPQQVQNTINKLNKLYNHWFSKPLWQQVQQVVVVDEKIYIKYKCVHHLLLALGGTQEGIIPSATDQIVAHESPVDATASPAPYKMMDPAKMVLSTTVSSSKEASMSAMSTNYVAQLQKFAIDNCLPIPSYHVTSETEPPYKHTFLWM